MDKGNFKGLKPHSLAKIKLYETYLKNYIYIISNSFSTINVFDPYSSIGKYENGTRGSAFACLDVISEAIESLPNQKAKFNVHFNDKSNKAYKELINNLKQEFETKKLGNTKLHVFNRSAGKFIDDALPYIEKMKNAHSFFFIDPFGTLESSYIDKILSARNTEAMLFLSIGHVQRYHSHQETFKIVAQWLFGDRRPPSNQQQFFKQAVKHLQQEMSQDGIFADGFLMHANGRAYMIFFFTKNIRGVEVFVKARWSVDKQDGVQFGLGSDEGIIPYYSSISGKGDQRLQKHLEDFLRTGPKTNKEIYQAVLLDFGFPINRATDTLKEMYQKGIIKKEFNPDYPGASRKTGLGLSYKYFKEETYLLQIELANL